jgi:glycosyltransferase involved in cell wall biosynthesis
VKILIQFGNKGNSVTDHLIRPLALADNIENIMLVCRYPGPMIPKVKYYAPPLFIAKHGVIAILYEFIILLFIAIFNRPDVIMGYLLRLHGLMAFIVAKLTGKPVIISLIAGPFELYSLGGAALGIDYTKPVPWFGKIFLSILKRSAAIITTGSITKNFLIGQGLKGDNIYPMINPPNNCKYFPMKLVRRYDVIAVGGLISLKHIEILLRAVAKVKESHGDIKVCVVGDGSCKSVLLSFADSLNIKANVDFVGCQKDVSYYLNSSKIFVHTSEREGFPNVFLEAMMCGLPSIVSNCGDITDMAREGFNAIVIKRYYDYEGFARAINRLIEDKEFYDTLAMNALNTVKELSVERIALEWKLILDEVAR